MYYHIYKSDNTQEYLNRYDLIAHTLLSFSAYLREFKHSPKAPPKDVKRKLINTAVIICGWANIKYDKLKNPYQNIANALCTIKKRNIIYTKSGRAHILLKVLQDTTDILNTTILQELIDISLNYLWAVAHLVYVPSVEPTSDCKFLEKLIHDFYKHNVLPKPVENIYVNLKKDDKFASVFFDDIYRRIEHNTNNMIFIEGEHGVGKSYTALHLAHEIDPDFDMEKQIVFDIPQFIEACNNMKRNNLIGKVILFDEIGAAASALTSWDIENILFDRYLQLFRYLRLTVIFTARDMSDTIKRLRKRVTHYIVMEEPRVCEIYKLKSKFDAQKDKHYVEYIPYQYEDEYNIYLLKYNIPKVPKDIATLYEKLRDENITSYYLEKIEEEVKLMKGDKLLSEIANEFIEKYIDCEEAYISKGRYKGRISTHFITEKFNVGEKTARKIRNIIYKLLEKNEKQ